jgi:hypothetical protein
VSATLEPAELSDTIARGDTYEFTFEVFEVPEASIVPGMTEAQMIAAAVPVNVSARSYRATARNALTDAVLKELTTAGGGITVTVGSDGTTPNRVTGVFPLADTAGWPVDQVKWDLEETAAGGTDRQTLVLATTTVKEDQSR